ncbi:MAG: DUF2158 domain-containing protein [Desulfobacteraceae bacterium]|nr:DUF2158 domain-containing protein [Desulfobacteraceae bacterium]
MTQKEKYNIGDIVKLISGGPEMTIEKVVLQEDAYQAKGYRCQWFAGKKLDHGFFPHESLEIVKKKS